ncbi:hypothetical protein, partial [Xenorhabdus bovienii]|uniref:hypothetical protein n=1 Tax=Xenorhabdus bovienii TaxID=40576 RepID=UPI001E4A3275
PYLTSNKKWKVYYNNLTIGSMTGLLPIETFLYGSFCKKLVCFYRQLIMYFKSKRKKQLYYFQDCSSKNHNL